jgi:hypothetical protein
VLQLLVMRHHAEQQRQLDLGQIAEVLGRPPIARGANASRRIVRAQTGGDRRGVAR